QRRLSLSDVSLRTEGQVAFRRGREFSGVRNLSTCKGVGAYPPALSSDDWKPIVIQLLSPVGDDYNEANAPPENKG
ncbi:MAG: hypothetical protein P8020_13350, partial [Acidobacteriota bacterium]